MARTCPHCGSDQIRDASLRTRDGVRRLLFYTPLRCRMCRHRFWVLNPVKPLLLFLLVGSLTGAAVWLASAHRDSLRAASPPASLPQARAEQGDAEAQLQLGMRYAHGDGVVQNDKEAAKWLARAARQGLAEAQYQYGLALLEGRGVVQDYGAAFGWIEKPAQRGHARAQYSLGELYRYGTGTAIDKARAYLWFNLAAAQGVDSAAKARDSLVWQLKPEQIAAMQEEARRMHMAPAASASATETPTATP